MLFFCSPDRGGVSRRRTGGLIFENPNPPLTSFASPLIRGAAMVLLLIFVLPLRAAEIPPLKTRVTDLTNTLNTQQRDALEHTLAEFEQRKGAQIAVLMLPTTQPETIEQYAVRVQESWKLGRKGVDDGVLLVVAKNDRRLHIEVGYGLEGILPDAIAKRIIDDDITPRFKEGDFYGGIRAGVDRVMRVVEGEKLPPPAVRTHPEARGFNTEWLMPLFFVGIFVSGILRMILGRAGSAGVVGTLFGLGAWLVTGFLLWALVVVFLVFMGALIFGGGSRGWSSGGFGGGG